MKFTFDKATLHHVEEHSDHDVQQLALLSHMTRQLLVAEQLDADMDDPIGHGVGLMALHQCFHNECVMLNEGFRKGDLKRQKNGGKCDQLTTRNKASARRKMWLLKK